MKILTAISPPLPAPTSTEHTPGQLLRWFLLGLLRALILASFPIMVFLYNWWNWDMNGFPWGDFKRTAGSVLFPTAALYWKNHWHLLKLPAALETPEEYGGNPPQGLN